MAESEHLSRQLSGILENAIGKKVFPGGVAGVVFRGSQRIVTAAGRHTYQPESPNVTADTVYDVASITKAIPTAALALLALEKRKIELSAKLSSWVGEFRNSFRDQVTLEHLLMQTINHGYALSSLKGLLPAEILNTILTHDFRSQPGQEFCYSNATSILLGMMMERVYGANLDLIAQEHFFGPLNMQSTTFSPSGLQHVQIAPSEIDPWRGREICGEIHDESAFALRSIMVPGSAGLFSTVPDLLNFLEMLLHDGEFGGKRIFEKSTIGLIQQNRLESISRCASLGWELNQVRFMGLRCSPRTIGKTGFTGCMILCDFEQGRAIAMLSNHIYPRRRETMDTINAVRREVANCVLGPSAGTT